MSVSIAVASVAFLFAGRVDRCLEFEDRFVAGGNDPVVLAGARGRLSCLSRL